MRVLSVAAALAVFLAGCSDPPASVGEADENFDDLDLEATSTTGIIRGLVIDTSITPVEGATITIMGAGLSAATNHAGVFGFKDLQPGTYFLQVSKPGYGTVQQSAEVVAGVAEPPIVKVMIERLPGTERYATYVNFQGYVGCSIQAANLVQDNVCGIGSGLDPDRGQIIDFGNDEFVPQLVQVELIWEYTQPIGERLSIIEYAITEGGSSQRIGNVWGPSPQVCRVTRDAVCDNGDGTGGGGSGLNETDWAGQVRMRVFANCFNTCVPGTALGIGAVLQQDYQQFGSAFYNYQPPEGWLYITDGPAAVPGS